MSQEDLIRKGLIGEKKTKVMQIIIDAKAALQALLNEATMAKVKPLKEINADAILCHAQTMQTLVEHIKNNFFCPLNRPKK